MIYCNGKPATAHQLHNSLDNITVAHRQLQKQGLLDKSVPLKMTKGTFAAYNPFSNKIFADAEMMACFNAQQTKAIMLHETKHSHQSALLMHGTVVLLGLMFLELAISTINGGVALIKTMRKPAVQKRIARRHAKKIAKSFGFWIAASFLAADNQRGREIEADMYAAEAMNDAKPMMQAFGMLDHAIAFDKPPEKSFDMRMAWLVNREAYGFFHSYTHPTEAERIENLRAFKPLKKAAIPQLK